MWSEGGRVPVTSRWRRGLGGAPVVEPSRDDVIVLLQPLDVGARLCDGLVHERSDDRGRWCRRELGQLWTLERKR